MAYDRTETVVYAARGGEGIVSITRRTKRQRVTENGRNVIREHIDDEVLAAVTLAEMPNLMRSMVDAIAQAAQAPAEIRPVR